MEAYLDNSATTKCLDKVVDIMVKVMKEDYGNPSAMHIKGMEAEKYVIDAKDTLSKILKVQPKEIVFTSGGTESNNLAIIGTAMANKRAGKHIITTPIEHPSVGNVMKYLENEGFEITYLSVDNTGRINIEQLKNVLRKDTILVSMMHVNNEIGAVMPIKEAGKIIKENNPSTIFHVDAIQSFGKYNIYPKKENIDLLSVSSHKIHGPKGVGFLYINEKIKITPQMLGGGQQKGVRSGTENVPGAAGLAIAAQANYTDTDAKIENLYSLKEYFISEINKIQGTTVNGLTGKMSAPHIVSVSFDGVRSEVLLHSLEDRKIYVSAGSACASNKPAVSATLKAIRVKSELLDSTIRFSFSVFTTKEEIDYCIEALKEILPMLRKYSRH